MKHSLLVSITAGLLLSGSAAAQLPHFDQATAQYGVTFEHQDGAYSYAMGGGAAWIDYDVDGDFDLFCASSSGRHNLFRNDGGTNFTDVTTSSELQTPGVDTIGVIVGDYNQDGLPDLFLANRGANQLYTNLGDGTFRNDAELVGVAGDQWSAAASLADFDKDGDLDIYVGNYVASLNFPYHYGDPNNLYINEGSSQAASFVDRAVELGVDDVGVFGPSLPEYPDFTSPEGQPTAGCTLSICTLDSDEDGDADLKVGNDFGLFVLPNVFYRNMIAPAQPLQFNDISTLIGFDQTPHYNMGINGADYDHDGDWDYYMSNLGDNLLLRNEGTHLVDVTGTAGPVEGVSDDEPDKLLTSWGTLWADFDNDGWEDLYVVNGHIPAAGFIDNDFRAENHLWMNQGDGTFDRVDPVESGVNDDGAGRGVAMVDLNTDGNLDFYVMNNGAPGVADLFDECRLYMNEGTLAQGPNGWIELNLRGQLSNLEAFGTRLLARAGELEMKRQLLGDMVFVASNARTVHFGLGSETDVDSLEVSWPSGVEQQLLGLPINRLYDLIEPVVTVDDIPEPVFVNGKLEMSALLSNHDSQSHAFSAVFQIRVGLAGPKVISTTVNGTVPAGQTQQVQFDLPISAPVHDQFLGTQLRQRVIVGSQDAWDIQELPFLLP